ncbi:probable disease resistance protein At4g19060 [Lactuca sativa]|nr:probable disease resistance protein At4g19060 [Lactuca sativa]
MAPEIVDDDIEQHLLEKITHGILRIGDQQNLVTRYYSLDSDFNDVKDILTRTRNPDYNGDWLSARRENLYYLNNLLNEWQLINKHSSFAPVEDREACLNIKKSLKKMMKEFKGEESSSRGDAEYSVTRHQDPKHFTFERNKEDVYRWSSRHGPRKVHGFEHNVMAMERELVMRNINVPYKVFGVVGVAGIGKTTLCQDIFGRKLVKEHFCPRIWVCLSKQPRDNHDYRKEIVVRILKCLGIKDEVISNVAEERDEHGLRKLILLIRLQLIGKRYLIVLDDAWNDDEFFLKLIRTEDPNMKWGEELAYALPKGCGGTVISSSRSDALLKRMLGKDVSLLYLKPHTKEIIDQIFRDTVIGYEEDEREFPAHLEELKMEILKKCDGIPLAAKLLAKIAREPLPLKQKPPPPTSVVGGHENKQAPESGGEQLNGGVDAGGSASASGVHDGEDNGVVLPNPKQKDGLPPIGPDQVA